MLNKKALELASYTVLISEELCLPVEAHPRTDEVLGNKNIRRIIEAYLAALPDDEDGLVKEMREEAVEQENGNVGDGACAADVLRRGADALEAARAKSSVPKGWRLVPGRQGSVWRGNLMKLLGVPSDPLPQTLEDEAEVMIRRVLAAAPEISDDR